jgi:hypothetical protein
MKTEKMVKKLLSKAEIVEDSTISESAVTDTTLDIFYAIQGELFFVKSTEAFLKKTPRGWFRFTNLKDFSKNENKVEQLQQQIDEIKEIQTSFVVYANKMKEYVDKKTEAFSA